MAIAFGWLLSSLATLLTMDVGGKLFAPDLMMANAQRLDWRLNQEPAVSSVPSSPDARLCAWSRTAAIGAILLPGDLDGAIATSGRRTSNTRSLKSR